MLSILQGLLTFFQTLTETQAPLIQENKRWEAFGHTSITGKTDIIEKRSNICRNRKRYPCQNKLTDQEESNSLMERWYHASSENTPTSDRNRYTVVRRAVLCGQMRTISRKVYVDYERYHLIFFP
jgi:hypothetical protein